MKKLRMLVLLTLSIMIAACGGGGGSDTATTNPTPTVSGVAAIGAPIVGQVWLKDTSGTQLGPVIIGAGGSYSFEVGGLKPPFFLEAEGTAGGSQVRLRGVGFSSGIVNINPFSELAIFVATGTDPAQVFTSLVTTDSLVLQEAVLQALDSIRQMIALLLTESNIGFGNPCRDIFVADGTGLDAVLDQISLEIDLVRKSIQVKDRGNNQTLASADVASGSSNLINIVEIEMNTAIILANRIKSKDTVTVDIPGLTGVVNYPFNLLQVVEEDDFNNDGQTDWTKTIDFQYNSDGRLNQRTISEGSLGSLTTRTEIWEYDADGRLSNITDSRGGSLSFGYALNNLITVTGNQSLMTITPGPEGNIETLITTAISGGSKGREDFAYNNLGLVTENHNSYGQMNQATFTPISSYLTSYDSSGRWLKTEEYYPSVVGVLSQLWTGYYDASGRLDQVICNYDDNEDGISEGRVTMGLIYDPNGDLRQVVYADDWDGDGVADSTSTTTYAFMEGGMPTAGFGTGMLPYNQKEPLIQLLLWEWMGWNN